jgi:CRP-like cAMP-binding protein
MSAAILSAKMPIPNRLLAAIPPNEYARLLRKMEEVELPFGTEIYDAGGTIRDVYFPNSGIVSLLAVVDGSSTVEVGITGREGMVGISAIMGVTTSAGRAIVSAKGTAMKLMVTDLENALGDRGVFQRVMLRFVRSMLVQVSRSAACYRFHKVDSRLARLLLMTSDRTGSAKLRMTHKFISNMLGVRREAVTVASTSFRASGFITYSRGDIVILGRKGLEAAACECYAITRDEEDSLAASI